MKPSVALAMNREAIRAAVGRSTIKSMRNRIAHGYFELNFDVVPDTVLTDARELVYRLPAIIAAASAAPRSS